jgi:hypothetical protein
METRLTRPTLAELWRVLLAELERLGVADAPAVARTLAVSALTGRPAGTLGVRVVRHDEDALLNGPGVRKGAGGQIHSRRRRRVLAAR